MANSILVKKLQLKAGQWTVIIIRRELENNVVVPLAGAG
jgi:hypothetical protein